MYVSMIYVVVVNITKLHAKSFHNHIIKYFKQVNNSASLYKHACIYTLKKYLKCSNSILNKNKKYTNY